MGDQRTVTQEAAPQRIRKREWVRTLGRVARYLSIRSIVILLTVLVGVYAAIWITNVGGHGDRQRKTEIEYNVAMALGMSIKGFGTLPQSERDAITQSALDAAFKAADLDKPFVLRSFGYFRDALTLSLGESNIRSRSGSHEVRVILMEGLPLTLLIFGVANLLTFFGGLFIALSLSRRYGSFFDRATTLLAPLFAAPPWFHGILLIIAFASILKILPFGGIVGVPLPETKFAYMLDVLKHMILPVSALTLGMMPFAIYSNRAMFLIHSSEDYVELAKAKGLQPSKLQRRYILRPVLPAIITNFAMTTMVAWQGVILTEFVFNWPGIGSVLLTAIDRYQVNLVTGAVTMLACLLGLTVLLLDILYALVDPRMTLGKGGKT